jgi:hypothetical protein
MNKNGRGQNGKTRRIAAKNERPQKTLEKGILHDIQRRRHITRLKNLERMTAQQSDNITAAINTRPRNTPV